MHNQIKRFTSIIFSLVMVFLSALPAFAAENDLKINTDANVKVGDKITYTIYMSDCKELIEGIQMHIFYDKDYLKLDKNSLKLNMFDGATKNTDNDGYIMFLWSNITQLADFSDKEVLVSADFEVLKSGSTAITEFVEQLYGDDMTYIKSYKMTYDISVNGKVILSDKAPLIKSDASIINNYQGDFINYIDGMGEENSPNKDDHPAVTGIKTTVKLNNGAANVTNDSEGADASSVIVVIAFVIVAFAIVAVFIAKRKDNLLNKDNTDKN